MKRLLLLTVLIFVAAFMLMAFDLLQGPPFESIEAFLLWLAFGGGSVVLIGIVLTLFVYQYSWWHQLPSWAQTTLPIIVAALIGAGARIVLELELYSSLSPAVATVALAFINWLTMQVAQDSKPARRLAARASNRPMKKG